jgi:hypothetical protein
MFHAVGTTGFQFDSTLLDRNTIASAIRGPSRAASKEDNSCDLSHSVREAMRV